ncbi:MAG: hypothetical protein CL678_09265 [Bdellovibrionaceae bacterium]|nr:hypothetical protein [Pseudobdellovibrionaceae bacterium]|tara:strand:+ start:1363 stop:1860 length:498 start_codon:yes stop_codon:yes gene_type:complete
MRSLLRFLDTVIEVSGKGVSYLTFFMVLTTFTIVILRYFFNVGWVWMQELVTYSHATIFLIASGYVFKKEGHVRVDIFYRNFSENKKKWINSFGILFFLFPMIGIIGVHSTSYILDSWSVWEGSKDGGGLEAVFLQKTLIWIFCLLLFIQGLSQLLSNHFKRDSL